MNWLWLALAVAVLAGLYVRLAGSDTDVWHRPISQAEPGDVTTPDGFAAMRAVDDAMATLNRLDRVILETPRTQRIAGSPDEGRVTYVTRSQVFGFPDYTTIEAGTGQDEQWVAVRGRLRFGKFDMGVNRARIEAWLEGAGL